MKVSLFIKNTLILTVYGVILRLMGMGLKIFTVNRIGAECTGLYQQLFSVYMLPSGAICAAMETAVTSAVSRAVSGKDKENVAGTVSFACIISFCASAAVVVGAFLFSGPISAAIGDMRCEAAVKMLALSVPFMGASACFKGYFCAMRNTVTPSNCRLAEQIVRIAAVVILLCGSSTDTGEICRLLFLSDLIAESFSCAVIYIAYRKSVKKLSGFGRRGRLMSVAIPVGLGRLSTNALRTVENIAVPNYLTMFCGSRSLSLSQFGVLKGMALPVLLFPSAIINGASSLIVPELARAQERRDIKRIGYCAEKAVIVTLEAAFFCTAVFFICSGEISFIVYHNAQAAKAIKALSTLVPFIYLEQATNGILNGLNKQRFIFVCSAVDSALRILLIVFLLPRFGIAGFIFIMALSNALTSLACFIKLRREIALKIGFCRNILPPMLLAFASAVLGYIAVPNGSPDIIRLILKLAVCGAVYTVPLFLIKAAHLKSRAAKA